MKKIVILLLALVLVPIVTHAQNGVTSGTAASNGVTQGRILLNIENPVQGADNLAQLIMKIVQVVLSFSYAVVAFFLILSGFKFVTAQGSEEKLREAKDTFKYTIIGAALVIGAQVIAAVLKTIFTQVGG